jgi:hypothetical protein
MRQITPKVRSGLAARISSQTSRIMMPMSNSPIERWFFSRRGAKCNLRYLVSLFASSIAVPASMA